MLTDPAFAAQIADTLREPVVVLDAACHVLDANRAFLATVGAARDEVIGHSLFDLSDGTWDVPALRSRLAGTLSDGGAFERFEVDRRLPDGERRVTWLHGREGPPSATGRTILLELTDVTGRRVAEEQLADRTRDLGAWREVEAQLRESEARYRVLFQRNPIPMFVFDAESLTFLAVNDATVARYGYGADELLGMTALDIHPPEERDRFVGIVDRRNGGTYAGPGLHRTKAGEVFQVGVVSHGIEFDGRKARLVLANDITVRMEAERERERLLASLEFERNRLAVTFQQALAFLVVLRGPEHVFELANEAYYRLVGRRELIGRPAREALPELVGSGLEEALARVLETGEPFSGTRVPLRFQRTPEGPLEERFVDFMYQAIEEADGTRSGILSHGIDVTDQVLAERAIRASEERYRALVELSPDGIVIHDGRVIRFANGAAIRMSGGWSHEDVVGRPVMQFVHQDFHEAVAARLHAIDGGEPSPPIEQKWVALDGTTCDVEVTSMPFSLAGERMVQTIFRDISERRLLEEQLRQAQKMEAVGRLAGGVAHDFNNLLTVIRANTEFLLEDLDHADPRRAEAVEIRTSCDRASRLTRQLLAFSRKQILEPRPLDLGEVIEGVKSMLTRTIGEDVHLETTADADVGSVMADAGQVEQVLLNLVVNARDAMPDGGRVLIATSEVVLTEQHPSDDRTPVVPGRYVMVAVSDTGTGMPPEVRARIFEPFFTTKPVGQGTGLGLATVYGIVKQSGGHVWVYSEPGHGTTFKLYFPRLGDARRREALPASPGHAPSGCETVLVVEDEDALRAVARRVLDRQGYRVIEARNGREALAAVADFDGSIDLVLTDVVMPGMGGGALAERMREVAPEARVLYMSGYTDSDIVRRGVLQPGVSFLQKPFPAERLLEMVRHCLDTGRGSGRTEGTGGL